MEGIQANSQGMEDAAVGGSPNQNNNMSTDAFIGSGNGNSDSAIPNSNSRKRPLRSLSKGNGASKGSNGTSTSTGVGSPYHLDFGTREDSSGSSDFDLEHFDLSDRTAATFKIPDKFQSIDSVPVEARPLMPVSSPGVGGL